MHVTDAFVWNPRLLGAPITYDVIRVTYYTSVTGGTARAPAVKDAIQAQMYSCGDERTRSWQRLNAAVFSKSAQSKKTKLVDMRICIDALANTMNAKMDVLYLVSGDGDFVPLVEEVMRHGVRVRVLTLGDCVADTMKSAGDEFAYLDDTLFKHGRRSPPYPRRRGGGQRTRRRKNHGIANSLGVRLELHARKIDYGQQNDEE